jgi:hypothetical protein|tara:strand:+ start:751 stop:1380 length:630 start_codon:yes stop_codon:yes gene_type:complete
MTTTLENKMVLAKIKSNKEVINTLESRGKAIASEWRKVDRRDANALKRDLTEGGLIYRTGELMSELTSEALSEGVKYVSGKRLGECSLRNVDRRRRSECLWAFENVQDILEFIKTSKKGFTSITALQLAMKKAEKPSNDDKQPLKEVSKETETVTETDTDEPTIHQIQETTEMKVAIDTFKILNQYGLDLDKFIDKLKFVQGKSKELCK